MDENENDQTILWKKKNFKQLSGVHCCKYFICTTDVRKYTWPHPRNMLNRKSHDFGWSLKTVRQKKYHPTLKKRSPTICIITAWSKPNCWHQIILCSCLYLGNVLRRTGLVASTHHINRINVGQLVEELTTAEGELGICLEELLSEETEKRHEGEQFHPLAGTHKKWSQRQQKEKKDSENLSF